MKNALGWIAVVAVLTAIGFITISTNAGNTFGNASRNADGMLRPV